MATRLAIRESSYQAQLQLIIASVIRASQATSVENMSHEFPYNSTLPYRQPCRATSPSFQFKLLDNLSKS